MQFIKDETLFDSEDLKEIVMTINDFNGDCNDLMVYPNEEEFFNKHYKEHPFKLIEEMYYGDYNYMDDYVRFNDSDELESLNELDYEKELYAWADDILETYKRLVEEEGMNDSLRILE